MRGDVGELPNPPVQPVTSTQPKPTEGHSGHVYENETVEDPHNPGRTTQRIIPPKEPLVSGQGE